MLQKPAAGLLFGQMTFLPAAVWNQIAETQELETPAAKVAFRLDPDQLAKLDDLLVQKVQGKGIDPKVARCLPMCLPLFLEREAIAGYVDQHPNLRAALPEMNDPEEAAILMQMDYRLTESQMKELERILPSPQAQTDWLEMAEQAKAA